MKNFITGISVLFIFINISNSEFFHKSFNIKSKMIEVTLAEKTVMLKCTEMSCNSCKNSITRSINKLDGIIELTIDLKSKIITVTIDDSKTNAESVLNAVFEAGYEAEIII